MRRALIALVVLFTPVTHAEQTSVTFNARATLAVETPQGAVTSVVVGSAEVFRGPIEHAPGVGRLVQSGLRIKSYEPPMIFELLPGRFLICANCTSIAARTFGISDGETYDSVKARAEAAPRDAARPAYPKFRPAFRLISAPPDFEVVASPNRSDLIRLFGPGIRLTSFTVEITDTPVTKISALPQMPWLCEQIASLQAQRTDGDSDPEIAVRAALRVLTDLAAGDCA
jgi:hypothetical protein